MYWAARAEVMIYLSSRGKRCACCQESTRIWPLIMSPWMQEKSWELHSRYQYPFLAAAASSSPSHPFFALEKPAWGHEPAVNINKTSPVTWCVFPAVPEMKESFGPSQRHCSGLFMMLWMNQNSGHWGQRLLLHSLVWWEQIPYYPIKRARKIHPCLSPCV